LTRTALETKLSSPVRPVPASTSWEAFRHAVPRCQHDAPSDAEFCPECGTKLAAACAQCGTANASGHKFCEKFGREG